MVIPLAENPELRLRYETFLGGVRFGRILEALDETAVWISHLHNQDQGQTTVKKSRMAIVTALVDRIDINTQAFNLTQVRDGDSRRLVVFCMLEINIVSDLFLCV